MTKAKQLTKMIEGITPAKLAKLEEISNSIKDWNNQPDTLEKIDDVLHRNGPLIDYPEFHVDSIDLIRINRGPTSSLSAQCEVWASDGEEDMNFYCNLIVNRKGEFV